MKNPLCILTALCSITFACQSVNTPSTKSKAFTLLEATSQYWTAGIPSGGSGTEYYFKVNITTADQLAFDSAWIDQNAFSIFIAKDGAPISNTPITFSNGDTITLRLSDLTNPRTQKTTSKPPVDFTGVAMISYRVGDKPAYFIIKEITKLPALNRQ